MARYTESVCRQCRREGEKLFLKGERCYSQKCAMVAHSNPPGQHGAGRRSKPTEYALQLREKQKVRRIYGVLEGQFHHYFEMASRMRGITGENLLSLLERRLDNVVYRLGLCDSRAQARQFVTHGHVQINGKKASIPSMLVKVGDVITVKQQSQSIERVKALLAAPGFGSFSVTTAEAHDRMIAFTSQLAHIVSNAYINSPEAGAHKGFSAGSYKDLTRVAWLNAPMWTELFLDNRDNLLRELDTIIANLQVYRDALAQNDAEALCAALEEGKRRKEEVDGV